MTKNNETSLKEGRRNRNVNLQLLFHIRDCTRSLLRFEIVYLPAAVCCPAEFVGGVLLAPPSRVSPSVPQPRFQAAVVMAGVPLPVKTVDDLYPVSKIKKRRRSNVVVSCNRENKFKAVSNPVWVCWKGILTDNTLKEEQTYKKYFNDNYSYIA